MSEQTVEEFRAQFAAAAGGLQVPEVATPVAEEAPETVVETVEEGQPRNPDGTFATKEGEPTTEEQRLLAGKYKEVDQLEQGYLEAQTLLGRQGNELAEARALRDELQALREQITTPPVQTPTYDAGSLDEQFATNPTIIPAYAQQALESGDNLLYGKTMAAWQEHDPFGAAAFHANAVADAKLAALRDELKPALEGMRQVETTNAFQQAFEAKAQQHDDFAAVLDTVTPETLAGFPRAVLDTLQTGDQQSKEQVLETLYRWQKAEQAGHLTQAVTEAAYQQATEALAAKTGAAVASSSGSQDRVPASGTDAWREQFQNSDAFKKAAGLV